jgi:uncharacterized protein YjiS (DUF1127 family)
MNTVTPLPSWLFSLLTWPLRVAEHRRAMNELGGLDDRELADIGLSRQDLRDATALPLTLDPTEQLAQRARERAERCFRVKPWPKPPAASDRPEPFRVAAE